VFEGHAFIVEAAVSLGGRELKPAINVYRLAHHTLLQLHSCSDASALPLFICHSFDPLLCTVGDVRVFEGHAFIVEAADSLGGRELKPGINVYRFAKRSLLRLHRLLGRISLTLLPVSDLLLCIAGDVRVFEGHAFIVEAAVSLGGRKLKLQILSPTPMCTALPTGLHFAAHTKASKLAADCCLSSHTMHCR
jgi:DNA topoisomerase VI subunit B